MAVEKRTMIKCRSCGNKGRDCNGLYCLLTGNNCNEYPEHGDCVNWIDESEPQATLSGVVNEPYNYTSNLF